MQDKMRYKSDELYGNPQLAHGTAMSSIRALDYHAS